MRTDNPIRDAERFYNDLEETKQPHISCAECGKRLYIATDRYCGDYAWNFGDREYYCDECAAKLYRKEIIAW